MKRGSYKSGYGNPSVRFNKSVDKDGPTHPIYGKCWVWKTGRFASGYGVLYVGGKNVKAHRFSYAMHIGPIPLNKRVLHKCDNRSCVNPSHLFLGSDADNIKDMIEKGRDRIRGEDNGNRIVDEDTVRWIRRNYRWRSPTHGSYGLSKRLGISQYAVMCIVRRKTWQHVE